MFTVSRRKPISQQLAALYGGTWKHIPFHGVWVCDDGERSVHRMRLCNHDGDCDCPHTMFLYDANGPTVQVPIYA